MRIWEWIYRLAVSIWGDSDYLIKHQIEAEKQARIKLQTVDIFASQPKRERKGSE